MVVARRSRRRGEVGRERGEGLRLLGAAGRVGLGVEVEDDVLPAQLAQGHRPALGVGQGEVGGGVPWVQARAHAAVLRVW